MKTASLTPQNPCIEFTLSSPPSQQHFTTIDGRPYIKWLFIIKDLSDGELKRFFVPASVSRRIYQELKERNILDYENFVINEKLVIKIEKTFPQNPCQTRYNFTFDVKEEPIKYGDGRKCAPKTRATTRTVINAIMELEV